MNRSYFSKMALIGFQYEPVSLDINKVYFEEKNIPNTRKKSRKNQGITEWCRCGKWAVRHTNIEDLSCLEILLNLNTCKNFRTHYRVLKVDLRLPRVLKWSSL